MRRTINACLVIFLACISSLSTAQSLDSKNAAVQASDQFMSTLSKGNTLAAYEQMKPYIGSKNVAFSQVANDTDKEMSSVWQQLGAPVAYDAIQNSSIGDHFYKLNYLLKFNDAALVWTFVYYQANQGWKLVGINYSTDIEPFYQRQ